MADKEHNHTSLFKQSKPNKSASYTISLALPIVKIIIFIVLLFLFLSGLTLSVKAYSASYHADAANENLNIREWKNAAQHAHYAVELQPGNADYHSLLALSMEKKAVNSLERTKLLVNAYEELDKALKLNPLDGKLWVQMARISEKLEDLNMFSEETNPIQINHTAEECLKKAMKLDPLNVYNMVAVAAYYSRRGDLDMAESFIAKAWTTSPQSVGRFYLEWEPRQDVLDKVVESYLTKRLANDPENNQLLCWLGGLYEARKEYALARDVYRKGLSTNQSQRFQRLIYRVAYKLRAK